MYFIFAESDSIWDFLSKPRSSGSGAAVLLENGLVLFMVNFPLYYLNMTKKNKTIFLASIVLLASLSWGVHADTLKNILDSGTLRVGVSLFTPWTMKNEAGQLSGFEIDVANKLADDIGVKPKFNIYQWDQIIAALIKGEIDVIAGGMAITPARALKINFSRPYADSGISLVTNTAKTQNISSLEELNQQDIVFTVVSGAASNELVDRLFNKATVMKFKTTEEAAKAVLDGVAHAFVASSPQPEFLALQHAGKLDTPLSKPLLTYKAGLAINKEEQEWLNFLNSWVTARDADKWLSATHKYWFNSLEWRK